jgi:hypothetical protein
MRLMGNYYSEWADVRGDTRRTVLVTLVACAVGATASAAVIFSLASSPTTQIQRTADFTESDSAERRCS